MYLWFSFLVTALLCESAVITMDNMFMSYKGGKTYFKDILKFH